MTEKLIRTIRARVARRVVDFIDSLPEHERVEMLNFCREHDNDFRLRRVGDDVSVFVGEHLVLSAPLAELSGGRVHPDPVRDS